MSFNFTVKVYSQLGKNHIILDKLRECFCVDGEASFNDEMVIAKGYGGHIIDTCYELAKLNIDCDVSYETDYGDYRSFTIADGWAKEL